MESDTYDANAIRILKGLEPVRLRPGMYIGGTDANAMHHLFAEVLDNAMDEVIAGHATLIEVTLEKNGYLTISDNGRGIPVSNHPQMPHQSTLEVIMTQLHTGAKFDGKSYKTSGGLHGVGASVVNALSDDLEVEVARDRHLYRQKFSRGIPQSDIEDLGEIYNRRGTKIRFHPDPDIFGTNTTFDVKRLYHIAESKAYLFSGVEIRWNYHTYQNQKYENIPKKAIFRYPGGLKEFLIVSLGKKNCITKNIFDGKIKKNYDNPIEWAVAWHDRDGSLQSYCNTIATKEGGTHETGLKQALTKGLKGYGELIGNKRALMITTDDVMISAVAMLSIFMNEPEFSGQTKTRLASAEIQRLVENAIRDPFDHWLTSSPQEANKLLESIIKHAEERLSRRKESHHRKTQTRKLRLPGKLADCTKKTAQGTELFIVEGDSAGGSAKQARNRITQAILPLRGKILNVASAGREKLTANQQIADIIHALGCKLNTKYHEDDLRYERIIIMTDADVDGAHIASLLITFFYQEIPDLIRNGHLYLAVPPLYRLSQSGKIAYARDDLHKNELLKMQFNKRSKIEIRRFKGLGEMRAEQLKETTMSPEKRTLLQIICNDEESETKTTVNNLMGNRADARFRLIQEKAVFFYDL